MVDFLDAAKNVLNGDSPFKEKVVPADNRIDNISQCKILWYQWENELGTSAFGNPIPTPASFLSKARSYDISRHIENAAFSKSLKGAAGNFSFTLNNSVDWTRFMKPGQWMLLFMCNDGNLPMPAEAYIPKTLLGELLPDFLAQILKASEKPKLPEGPSSDKVISMKPYLRCMGMIQRVAIRSATNADGTVETVYTVTGKDFGGIYEDTELWFNANSSEQTTYSNLLSSSFNQEVKNLSPLLAFYHDIFLNIRKALKQELQTSFKSFLPQQWILPDRLISDMGFTVEGDPFYGNVKGLLEFSPTLFEIPDPNPMSNLQGRAWDKMKNICQPEFHELFTELSDRGNPKLYFRPIPWVSDSTNFPKLGTFILKYADLASTAPVNPPAPINSTASKLDTITPESVASLAGTVQNPAGPDIRTLHSVKLSAAEIESYDVGQDYHERYNMFLVDSALSPLGQTNSWALISANPVLPFPFKEENDIKRYGFKPCIFNVVTFNTTNSQLFGNSPTQNFMLEANYLVKDYYQNAEDLFGGSITLATGKNEIKLGKGLVTNNNVEGIGNMLFYLEGYTDSFSVNGDGTASWTQNLTVTRGTELKALDKSKSTKERSPTRAGSFHVSQNSTSGDGSLLGSVKDFIKNPLG